MSFLKYTQVGLVTAFIILVLVFISFFFFVTRETKYVINALMTFICIIILILLVMLAVFIFKNSKKETTPDIKSSGTQVEASQGNSGVTTTPKSSQTVEHDKCETSRRNFRNSGIGNLSD